VIHARHIPTFAERGSACPPDLFLPLPASTPIKVNQNIRARLNMNANRKLILIGMKSSGKTTIGKLLAHSLDAPFVDMDSEIERWHCRQKGEQLHFRDIFAQYGKDYFRDLETQALRFLAASSSETSFVLATGGGLPLAEENRTVLRDMGVIVFLDVPQDVLLARIVRRGIPAFFPYPQDPARSLAEILAARNPIYSALAQLIIECGAEPPHVIASRIITQLEKDTHADKR
jgi:shikimate kinase